MDPFVPEKVVSKGVGILEFRKNYGEVKAHSTCEAKTTYGTVGCKDVRNFTWVRPLDKQQRVGHVIDDQAVQKSSTPSKALRKGTRVREIRKNVGLRKKAASQDATDPASKESTPHSVDPPLRFFRKRGGKGKPFRAESLRKQFLRRELTFTD